MALYGSVEILKLHVGRRFREVICGFREVILMCGFWEVIWVGGFKIRCVGRTDWWVGQVGKYVRWLGSSVGSGK